MADRAGRLVPNAPTAEPADIFTYDPRFPAPSLGGHSCCGAQTGPQGPYDQTPVEQRSDVLVYTSDSLEHDTEVTGSPSVDLWAQSTATDTDFTAKVEVVKPDGQVINLNNGILRTSFRDSLSIPALRWPAGRTNTTSKSGPLAMNSGLAIESDWKFPAVIILSSRRIRTPVNRSARTSPPPLRRRPFCTTPRIPRR